MSEDWKEWEIRDLISSHVSGPSPDCEERNISSSEEWGVLKTTAITWRGWDQYAHKVLPKAFWGQEHLAVRRDDVLVTKAGPRHRVGVSCHVDTAPERIIVSGKMIGLRPRKDLVSPIVLAGMIAQPSAQKYIHDRTTGMAESQVNFANQALLSTSIRLPDLPLQSKIAEVLDTLDAAIRGTEAVVAKLKAMKQGLLHDLLTRGIDANGDLRPPHTEAPHLYTETPLGWLPKEWDALKVEEIGDVRTGKTPPAEDPAAWGEATPFVTPGDIAHTLEISKSERHLSVRGQKYVPKVPAGATLVVCIGSTIGKVGYVSEESGFNQQINAVVPNAQHEPAYIFSSICKSIFQLHRLAGLQAVPIVNKSEFQKIRIPVAPKPEQSEIIERLNQLERREASEGTELKKMRATKSGLMDDLLTGQVSVVPLLEEGAANGT